MDLSGKAKEVSANSLKLFFFGLLSVRVIQGFIYWGGGSRRFIYDIDKLNPHAASWMANKFQTSMPGALFGFDHIVSYLLQHFWLLYPAVIIFSLAELIVGLFLMLGLFTRVSAAISMIFSIVLMILFGWQGATCIDEWTMAACNLAMGATLLVCGSPAFALDNVLYRRKPQWRDKKWLKWVTGSFALPVSEKGGKRLAFGLLAFVVLFDVGTYNHYRGSVYSAYHSGPVSPTVHHLTLKDGQLLSDGRVSVHAYLDAGTPEAPVYVMEAQLTAPDGKVLYHWDGATLAALPKTAFRNDYAYNQFKTGHYGIQAAMGAASTIILPAPVPAVRQQDMKVELKDVAGHTFSTPVRF